MFGAPMKRYVKYYEDNKNLIESGKMRLVRRYGDEEPSFYAIPPVSLAKLMDERRKLMENGKETGYSYEEVIFMSAPHTFTADIDMDITNEGLMKEYWECVIRGLPSLLDIVGVECPDDYLTSSLIFPGDNEDFHPTPHQEEVMRAVWIVTHMALTVAKQTRYNGSISLDDGTIRLVDVTIEASIINKDTLAVSDDDIKKYSYHVRTNAFVKDFRSAGIVSDIMKAFFLVAALNGIGIKAGTTRDSDQGGREIITKFMEDGYANLDKYTNRVRASLPERYRPLLDDVKMIKNIDRGFYSAQHNLRLAFEVKPGKDHYLYPYTFGDRRTFILRTSYSPDLTECIDITRRRDDVTRVSRRNEPSDPTFVKMTKMMFMKEFNARLTLGDGDGMFRVDYRGHGHHCKVCNVHHEKSTNNTLSFSGAFCYIICSRQREHRGKSILYNKDDDRSDEMTSTEKMAKLIEREKRIQHIIDNDGDEDDEDEEEVEDAESIRRDNASTIILESDRNDIEDSHDVNVFTSPTLVEEDDCKSSPHEEDEDEEEDYVYPKITIPREGLLYIRSALGTGKTKWLLRHITDMLTSSKTHGFIVASTRIVQTQAFAEKYNSYISDFIDEKYRRLPKERRDAIREDWSFVAYNKTDDVNQHRNVIIQVDSFGKMSLPTLRAKPYTLILDEAVSILEQTQSSNIKDYSIVADTFRLMMGYAQRVILMDGHIITEHIECFDMLRAMTRGARKSLGRPIDDRPRVYVNTYRPQNDRSYHMTSVRDDWLSQLAHIAGGSKRSRIVVATNSLDCCRTVAEMIRQSPDEYLKKCNVKVYTSETGELEKRSAFMDVHSSWGDADILIYSPTVGAGISFELRRFDALFGFCSAGSTTAETFVQLLNRVRDIRHNDAYVYVDPMCTYGLFTSVDALKRAVMNDDYVVDNLRKTINDDGEEVLADEYRANGILRIYATTHENRSKVSMMRRVTKLLLHLSKNVQPFEKDEDVEVMSYTDNKTAAKATAYERFDAALVLNDEDYEELKELKKDGRTTAAQGLSVDKTAIMKKYKMAPDFTNDGWASQYIPFIEDDAEKLRYVAEHDEGGYGAIIKKVKEQSMKAAGTVVSEYVDKTIVSGAILALADHLGTPSIINEDDVATLVTFENGRVKSYQVEAGKKSMKLADVEHTVSSWKKFMRTSMNFNKAVSPSLTIAKQTVLLSGKASRWSKTYMSMYYEILGFLSEGREGTKKHAKSLDTLHRRLAKMIFTFYGNDAHGKDDVTFKRANQIRYGDGGAADDWKTHVPRVRPIISDNGHAYIMERTSGSIIGDWGVDGGMLSSETLVR